MTDEWHTKPFRIELTVDAPPDAVWRALTDPEEIRRWFGWEYDGLEPEIQFIFAEHSSRQGDRLEIESGATVEVTGDGSPTVVRVWSAGGLDGVTWEDLYDEVVQGWRTFFHQLRYYVERAPAGARRTVFLTGQAVPAEAFAALETFASGRDWDSGRHQRAVAVDRWGGALVSLVTAEPADSKEPSRGQLTVTTYGLDDAAFDRVLAEWTAWWRDLAKDVEVTT